MMQSTNQKHTEILFVTGNQNKVNEASMYLPGFAIQKGDIFVPEIQSVDVAEVIRAKLKYAFSQTGKPCFVMDASLVINGLCKNSDTKKFPGALIKDVFGHMGDKNICYLVGANADSGCLWQAVLGYFDGVNEHYFSESLEGDIATFPRGTNGYDWDTIFVPKGTSLTFAEMLPEEKQRYALTKNLYRQFLAFLTNATP